MRATYHELVARAVVDAEGKHVGRVADLRAENVNGRLRVTGLLVGEEQLLARFGLQIAELVGHGRLIGYFVPWPAIVSIDKRIKLRVGKESLERLPAVGRLGYSV